jgi:hypothetical protein
VYAESPSAVIGVLTIPDPDFMALTPSLTGNRIIQRGWARLRRLFAMRGHAVVAAPGAAFGPRHNCVSMPPKDLTDIRPARAGPFSNSQCGTPFGRRGLRWGTPCCYNLPFAGADRVAGCR